LGSDPCEKTKPFFLIFAPPPLLSSPQFAYPLVFPPIVTRRHGFVLPEMVKAAASTGAVIALFPIASTSSPFWRSVVRPLHLFDGFFLPVTVFFLSRV